MKRIKEYLRKNTLFKNSVFLIMSNGLLSLGGFIFWIFVARAYSTYEIGIATSLIAMVGLISSLALLGFNTGIMRFLPMSQNKSVLISSTVLVVILASSILGSIVLLNINNFSPPLSFVSQNPYFFVFFIIFTIIAALNLLLEAILTAFRSAKYVLIKNFVQAIVKLFLPFLFIGLGGFGVFSAYYGGGIVALFIGGVLLYRTHKVIYGIRINLPEVKKMMTLSIGTYVSALIGTAPIYILPILITNILGPQQTAFFYIVATITNVLNLIPQVIAQNLMVEGSYDDSYLETHLKKVILLILVLLVPCIIAVFLFGNFILLVFGKQYSTEGFVLLRILSVCSLVMGANYILSVILIIFHQIKSLIFINIINAVTLFSLSYYFIHLGIVGVGYATIIAQLLLVILYILGLAKAKKLFLLRSLLK